jgi:hypothetical protein
VFDCLKASLMSTPMLAYPDFSLPFTIQSDASDVAIGAVIGQHVLGKFRPIMYASRHLTGAETRYSTTERKLLAVVWAAKKFSPYIYGQHVTIVTDHQPLATMKSLKEPTGRIGRLLWKPQEQDCSIVYQPGSSNVTADLLSRHVDLNVVEVGVDSCIN